MRIKYIGLLMYDLINAEKCEINMFHATWCFLILGLLEVKYCFSLMVSSLMQLYLHVAIHCIIHLYKYLSDSNMHQMLFRMLGHTSEQGRHLCPKEVTIYWKRSKLIICWDWCRLIVSRLVVCWVLSPGHI